MTLTSFGRSFQALNPLSGYMEAACLLGAARPINPEIAPSLGRFLAGIHTGSSPIFTHVGDRIQDGLHSREPQRRLEGLRLLQLALLFEGSSSEVIHQMAREIRTPQKKELSSALDGENLALKEALRRHDKGWMGRFAVRMPVFDGASLEPDSFENVAFGLGLLVFVAPVAVPFFLATGIGELCSFFSKKRKCEILGDLAQRGNLQAALRLTEIGEEGYLTSLWSHAFPDMMLWLGMAEAAARGRVIEKPHANFGNLTVDACFLNALKNHKGTALLKLPSDLALDRSQAWMTYWVEAFATLQRHIDFHEARSFAESRSASFTEAAINRLLEITHENWIPETSQPVHQAERRETVQEAQHILGLIASRRPEVTALLNEQAGPWWVRRQTRAGIRDVLNRPEAYPSDTPIAIADLPSMAVQSQPIVPARLQTPVTSVDAPGPAGPLLISLTQDAPLLNPRPLTGRPNYFVIGRSVTKQVPLYLNEGDELVVSLDAENRNELSVTLRYRDGFYQIADIRNGKIFSQTYDANREPRNTELRAGELVGFGDTLIIGGYPVRIIEESNRLLEME